MFRRGRQTGSSGAPLVTVDNADREAIVWWWERAIDRVRNGPAETSWLTGTMMVQMALGYSAENRMRVDPFVYAFITRHGYALRMFVDAVAAPAPLDVSEIDPDSVARLAQLPVDEETGMLSGDTDESEHLLLPIVMLASDVANIGDRFTEVVSVEPYFWNSCAAMAVGELQDYFREQGAIRRKRDLPADIVENFLRYGFALRCIDEAFEINT